MILNRTFVQFYLLFCLHMILSILVLFYPLLYYSIFPILSSLTPFSSVNFFKFSIASPQLHIRAEDYDNGIGFQQVRTVCTDTNTYSDTYTYACTNTSTT